jgi:RNA polymerase subunit RPABC4/transcription elongation factor Spt4
MFKNKDFSCPNCNDKVFTLWQKINMGYFFPKSCPNCAAKICADWKSLLIVYFLAFSLPSLIVWTVFIATIYINFIPSLEIFYLIAILLEIILVFFFTIWGCKHYIKLEVKNTS